MTGRGEGTLICWWGRRYPIPSFLTGGGGRPHPSWWRVPHLANGGTLSDWQRGGYPHLLMGEGVSHPILPDWGGERPHPSWWRVPHLANGGTLSGWQRGGYPHLLMEGVPHLSSQRCTPSWLGYPPPPPSRSGPRSGIHPRQDWMGVTLRAPLAFTQEDFLVIRHFIEDITVIDNKTEILFRWRTTFTTSEKRWSCCASKTTPNPR